MEATLFLAGARLALAVLPFKKVAGRLGEHMGQAIDFPLLESDELPAVVITVNSIKTMSRHLPWECKCLVQAAALKMMLKRRRIISTLYLGVVKDETFMAHAWLRVGDTVVLGDNGLEKYSVVSYFT